MADPVLKTAADPKWIHFFGGVSQFREPQSQEVAREMPQNLSDLTASSRF
jgi:hypothetical protein